MYSLRTFLEILIHSSLDTFENTKACSISFKLGHTNVVFTMLYNTKQNITTATNTKITNLDNGPQNVALRIVAVTVNAYLNTSI